jgi:hypothetical protein
MPISCFSAAIDAGLAARATAPGRQAKLLQLGDDGVARLAQLLRTERTTVSV